MGILTRVKNGDINASPQNLSFLYFRIDRSKNDASYQDQHCYVFYSYHISYLYRYFVSFDDKGDFGYMFVISSLLFLQEIQEPGPGSPPPALWPEPDWYWGRSCCCSAQNSGPLGGLFCSACCSRGKWKESLRNAVALVNLNCLTVVYCTFSQKGNGSSNVIVFCVISETENLSLFYV